MLACDYAGIKRQAGQAGRRSKLWPSSAWPTAPTTSRPSSPAASSSASRIARALVNKPEIILADEPTGNLDSERSAEVLALLRQFNREHGQTIVLVTHDAEVGAACDRIIRMRDGRIRDHGPGRGSARDGGDWPSPSPA